MRKTSLLALLLTCAGMQTYAQSEFAKGGTRHKKKYQHHVGVQMNELVRQVFNFNNAASTNTNPYLLIYSINATRTGWGLRLGAGYNYQSFSEEDAVTSRTTDLNVMNFRLGVEKAFRLSPKWTAGAGIDGVYHYDDNQTTAITRSFDTSTVATKSLIRTFGGGAMAWLRYRVTDRVLIGTETSFYYTAGNQNQKIDVTARANNVSGRPIRTTTTITDHDTKEGVFSVPIAFYLIVRF